MQRIGVAWSEVKDQCEAAKRFADEQSEEKCDLAMLAIKREFWRVYPKRSMGPTCEAPR